VRVQSSLNRIQKHRSFVYGPTLSNSVSDRTEAQRIVTSGSREIGAYNT